MRSDVPLPDRFPCPECEAEEVNRLVRKIAAPICILAVDDLRLLGMQGQLAGLPPAWLVHLVDLVRPVRTVRAAASAQPARQVRPAQQAPQAPQVYMPLDSQPATRSAN